MAIGELGVQSLDDVYDMSWAEFKIRLFAFNRMQRNEIELTRVHAYHVASGGMYAMSPKHFPKTIDKFWRLDKKVDKEAQRKRIEFLKQKQQEARERKKKRANG